MIECNFLLLKTPSHWALPGILAEVCSKIVVLLYVLFVLYGSMYCLCVNVYSTSATGWQPNCS